MSRIRTPCERVHESKFRDHLGREEHGEQTQVREHRCERDVQSALDEEERREEGERHDAKALLLLAVLGVVRAHDEAEDEGGKDGVAVRQLGEHHEQEQAGEHQLDLGLDDAVAVAAEEPGRDARQRDDEDQRHAEEEREPEVRLDEDRRKRDCGAQVGHEGGAHQELPDVRVGESSLDEDRVDDRERRGRECRPGDERRPPAPVEGDVRHDGRDHERTDEGHDTDADRRGQATAHVRRVDLHPGEKGEDDRGEAGDERQPVLRLDLEGVAGDDAERQLDERDRDADLDRDHAREKREAYEDCGELNGVQPDLRSDGCSVEAISPEGRLDASLIARRDYSRRFARGSVGELRRSERPVGSRLDRRRSGRDVGAPARASKRDLRNGVVRDLARAGDRLGESRHREDPSSVRHERAPVQRGPGVEHERTRRLGLGHPADLGPLITRGRIVLRGEHDGGCGRSGRGRSHPSEIARRGRREHPEQIVGEQREDRLRLGVAEATVELEDLRSVRGQYEPGVQQPHERRPSARELEQDGPVDLLDERVDGISVDSRNGGIRAHASRVRTTIAVEDPLVILRR